MTNNRTPWSRYKITIPPVGSGCHVRVFLDLKPLGLGEFLLEIQYAFEIRLAIVNTQKKKKKKKERVVPGFPQQLSKAFRAIIVSI